LRVAVRLFTERGYDATSMEDLARALGIGKSAIYHHVSSKEELLRLATGRALDGLFGVAAAVEGSPGRAIERLERLVRGSVEVLAAEQPFVTLLLRVHGNTRTEREALARRRQFDQFTASLVKQAVADGDLRPDIDPGVTARLLFGLVNSVSEWYRPVGWPGSGIADADLADAICKLAFDGLRASRPRDRDSVARCLGFSATTPPRTSSGWPVIRTASW
jgi:AcrR family transcriptional regulator